MTVITDTVTVICDHDHGMCSLIIYYGSPYNQRAGQPGVYTTHPEPETIFDNVSTDIGKRCVVREREESTHYLSEDYKINLCLDRQQPNI
jgi:hypothetical protein